MKDRILKLDYITAIELGFKRINSPDEVWYDEYGFEYFIVEKRLSNNAVLYWLPCQHIVELCVTNTEGNLTRRPVTTMNELESLILLGKYYQEKS